MRDSLSYVWALIALSAKPLLARPGRTVILALAMFAQNMLFFATWIVFFRAIGSVRGWHLPDMFLLYGIVYVSLGSALMLGYGIVDSGRQIAAGEIDYCLTRPRHPLPQLVFTRCSPMNIGDISAGLLFLAAGSGLDVGGFCLAVATSVLVAILFLSVMITFQSLSFFMRGGNTFAMYLTDTIFYLSSVPQHAQGLIMKAVLFTVLPAGFMNFLPVEIIRFHRLDLLAVLAIAVALYASLAWQVFERGLRRYVHYFGN